MSLKKAFNTTDENEICNWILDKGQIQVSNLERSAKLENTGLEIATMISEKCVNTMSQRRFTIQAIRDAMKEAEFCVHPRKDVKQQFLDCVKVLKEKGVLPIERAKMRLAIISTHMNSDTNLSEILDRLKELDGVKDATVSHDGQSKVIFLSDPKLYRIIDKLVKEKNEMEGNGWRLEIIQQCVFQEGEVNLESELERKEQLLALQRDQKRQESSIYENGDDVVEALSQELQKSQIKKKKKSRHKGNKRNDDSDNDVVEQSANLTNRQKLKKAQKKSKKAKRREIEEAAERLQKQREEEQRQAEQERKLMSTRKVNATKEKCEIASPQKKDPAVSTIGLTPGSTLSIKSCNTCGGSFTTTEYRAHFRSDWHRHNLKLKMKGLRVLTVDEYKDRDGEIFVDH